MTDLPVYRATLEAAWIDYNGHLRDAYYAVVASAAVDAVMDDLGIDAAYRERTHCTLYTLEVHLHYLHEVKFTDSLELRSSVLDFDAKRIHMGCIFTCPRVEGTVATVEMMLIHVHQGETPSSVQMPESTLALLTDLKAADTGRESFAPGSRKIEIKRR